MHARGPWERSKGHAGGHMFSWAVGGSRKNRGTEEKKQTSLQTENPGHHSYMHVQIGKRAARACFLGMMTTKANSPSAPPPVHPPTHAPTKPAGWPAGPHKARIVRNATAFSQPGGRPRLGPLVEGAGLHNVFGNVRVLFWDIAQHLGPSFQLQHIRNSAAMEGAQSAGAGQSRNRRVDVRRRAKTCGARHAY